MLLPHEILGRLPASTTSEIFAYLHEHQRPIYRATLDSLAKANNLRPVFLERKPRADRHLWMADKLRRKNNDSLAAHLLQAWLVGAHKNLLCDFLDGLGIPHDENGTIENLPEAPSRESLTAVIDSLRTRYDQILLATYLNAFQALDSEGWHTLAELLAQDPSLQLPAPTP